MKDLQQTIAFARGHKEKFLEELIAFCKIPSISTLPEHEDDIREAADWVASQLRASGFDNVDIVSTEQHPVVYGDSLQAGPEAPTLLIYGHYDVQPTDPLDEWISDPFDPQQRGENLYARGVSDMKAQLVAFLKALQSINHSDQLPVNLRFMIEGEEEVGSPNLAQFIQENKEILDCDFCLNVDASILAADIPSLTYALRGLAYFEIRLQGPKSDLHSGLFGGAVENPAQVLCELLAGMRDEKSRVTLPGFYDTVRPIAHEERQALAALPQSEPWWLQQTGAPALSGEQGFTPTERATARPTLDINGLYSGFIGVGSKTVLPARAMAKLSMRLVPDQTPAQIERSLHEYLQERVPSTVSWELETLASCRPGMIDRDSAPVRAAGDALKKVWQKTPQFNRQGGSVPVVGMIEELLGVESLMLGFGLPDDNLHAPNEKQHLPTFYRGIETYIHFLCTIADVAISR